MTEQVIFDFILADPYRPYQAGTISFLDDAEIIRFIQFSRRALISGAYLFVFVGWNVLPLWHKLLEENDMSVCGSPFRVCLDTEQLQKNNSQQYEDPVYLAIVARKPGRNPECFTMDLSTPYLHIPRSQYSRKFGIIDKVPVPPNKLTVKPRKKQLRSTEKSPKLYLEILQTFCREGGRVLDTFAGPMTSGMACISSRRPCTLLEPDAVCVRFALPRLKEFAEEQLEADLNSSKNSDLVMADSGSGHQRINVCLTARQGDEQDAITA